MTQKQRVIRFDRREDFPEDSRIGLDSGFDLRLGEATRPTLIQTACLLWPDVNGSHWLNCTKDQLYSYIKVGDHDLRADDLDKHPATKSRAKTDALLETLRQLVGQGDDVTDARIRAIVREEVPKPIELLLPDLTVTRIDDLTHEVFPILVQTLAAHVHVFLTGPPGTGKSTLARQAAAALSLEFGAISLGPTTPTSKIFGYMTADGHYVRSVFREMYENGGIMLFDEIDNGHPGILAEINQSLSNGTCAFPDGMVDIHEDTLIVAAGNTYGTGPTKQFVGRNQLDAATLDRFATIEVPIDEPFEMQLAKASYPEAERWVTHVRRYRKAAEDLNLQVIFSPRASIEGARLLAAGLEWGLVEDIRLFPRLTPDTRKKLEQEAKQSA